MRVTDRFKSIAALSLLLVILGQLSILGKQRAATEGRPYKTSQGAKRVPAREVVKLKRSPQALIMSRAFSEGKLPEPARLPRGNVDQQAATLAKAVSLRDESSTAALYAAVLAAGFAIRDTDGSVMQTQERGQGLLIPATDLAATAKLYSEEYGVMLSHLSDAFVRSIPELKDVPLANVVLDGIRAGANSTNPSVRFLSRFIVELGKNHEPSTDLLGNVDPAKTRLDAIQVSLILSRLTGDLAVLQKKTAQVNRASKPSRGANYAHAQPRFIRVSPPNFQSPCPTNDLDDLILDSNTLASTTLFGLLSDRLGGKLKWYGDKAGIASIVAAVFKFVMSYALLDVEISMDAEMLERTKNRTPGETRTLTAKLKIDKNPWETLNCLRPIFSIANLDIEFPKSGPLADTTVEWSIVLGADSRGALGAFVDHFTGDSRDDLIYLKPKPGAHPMPNKQKADENGESVIDVVGAPQKEDMSRRKLLEVYKGAGVTVGVQIKPMKIKDATAALSTFVDIVGNVVSLLSGDAVGGGLGVVFETMYRSNWYSAKPFYFMVKDWEPCKGLWQGTITYSTSLKEKGSAESFVNKSSWNDVEQYNATAQISGRRTAEGAQMAMVKATASQTRERISSGKGVCYRTSTQIQHVEGSATETTTAFSITYNPRAGEYTVSAPTVVVEASGSSSVDSEVKGTCNNPYNKDLHERREVKGAKLTAEGPSLYGKGRIDPNNPDVISGTDSLRIPTNKGGERTATITWNLKRCQDQ
jgi:hypothetical protein